MLTFEFIGSPALPLEVFGTAPQMLESLSLEQVRQQTVWYGNKKRPLSEFFRVDGDAGDGHQQWTGDLSRVCGIGSGMESGWIQIAGDAGDYVGGRMTGGTVLVDGCVGDAVGIEMAGGLIHVRGDAGNDVGGVLEGSRRGMRGGTLLVAGSVGHRAGRMMRRGVLAVSGNTGNCCGYMMRAGTIVVAGQAGKNLALEMRRGTVILLDPTQLPKVAGNDAFAAAGCVAFPVNRLLRDSLQQNGWADAGRLRDEGELFHGDLLYQGRGEILVAVEGDNE